MAKLTGKGPFRISAGLRNHHNYRLDSAWKGEYLTRLPDRKLVLLVDYERELAELSDSRDTGSQEAKS